MRKTSKKGTTARRSVLQLGWGGLSMLAYRSLHVPSDAPFELKPSSGKGWSAFATRRIERGAMILREKPLFVIRKPHEEITEEDVWAAFQQLIPSEKQQFLGLSHT